MIETRPVRSPRTRFLTMPEIRFEFGTITAERSKVWISVERTEIRRTMPSESPITTWSPTRIGRSHSSSKPETKLLTIDCRPKPMPTESAPATMVSFSRLRPR